MKIRDRIIDFRRVKASELLPHPKNWRQHPDEQADAMRGILAEVGIADAVLVRETPEGLQLIDGHLRADISPDTEWPVLVLDVDDKEADAILATHDPLCEMAHADMERLRSLLDGIEFDNDALQKMTEEMAQQFDVDGVGLGDLPAGERQPIQQMTFILTDEQAESVKRAVVKAKESGPFVDTGNSNDNGNAIWRVAEDYIGSG